MSPGLKGCRLLSSIKMAAVFGALLGCVALVTWMERRQAAFHQDRLGPNRVGPLGLFQPIADGLKNFVKEEVVPYRAERALFLLAPALMFVPSVLLFAVIPFASPLPLSFDFTLPLVGQISYDGDLPMIVADLPIGILMILAVSRNPGTGAA